MSKLGELPYERKTCVICGNEFVITYGEKVWMTDKGFPLPRRCKECRQKRKEREGNDK